MKIELLTQEQHDQLKNIYESFPELTLQNTGYEGINRDKLPDAAKEADKTVNSILKTHVAGFSSFQNFRLNKKSGELELRFQYNYNYDNNGLPFTGVGYILLTELLNGFNA